MDRRSGDTAFSDTMSRMSDELLEPDIDRSARVYLACLIGMTALIIGGAGLYLGLKPVDHFAAISPAGQSSWYQDFAGDYVTEIQDQELFFHDIGRSIEQARKADIVILGSSLVSFALNEDVIHERLETRYGLKVYNMAFVGVASGEFSRQIIEKNDLHPRLLIINADDGGGGGNFFSRNLTRAFGPDVRPIPAVQHGRMRTYEAVIRRNLRWRFEGGTAGLRRQLALVKPGFIPRFDRNSETGAADMTSFPRFLADDNPRVKMTRDPNCHTTPEAIATARDFVRSVDAPVVLTLIPNFHGCFNQVKEVAEAVGIETALPARTDYSSWDGGGHLDRNGAIDFTRDLVDALEKTTAFQALRRNHAGQR
ncbi:MAG: hypothetical protein ABW213_18375 [Tardiphaga sp.]